MLFDRVKPLEAIIATAEKKALRRSLGPFQLTMLGIGAVIGTGIFVLTAEAAQKAGPGMMLSFVIAGFVCAVAALCYSELAAMVPVAGSAYTYTYAVMGELLAWMVGWALILEYAVGASAVAVGWSGYFVGLLQSSFHITLPQWLTVGPSQGGLVNVPAAAIALLVTGLLIIGTTESARVNALLVAVKVAALTAFIVLTLPAINTANFTPFIPNGWGTVGVVGAASSIFFAYVGFDAVSTAAEETRNPQRNVPIGLIGSLLICTVFYLLVSAGAIGAMGAQPVRGLAGEVLLPGSSELAQRCAQIVAGGATQPLVCSREALAHVLRVIGDVNIGNLLGLAAFVALPSVVLMMIFGQTRIFFVMARDGLLPQRLASVHPRFKTPHVVTMLTGVVVMFMAAFLPVGKLADYSNSGTLFAFAMVALSVLVLRIRDPKRARPFRTPMIWLVAPLAFIGCVGLYLKLPLVAILVLPGWGFIGLLVYFSYSRSRSHVARGVVEVEELKPSPIPNLRE
ncbi:MAG TPA: amino acid permease [Rhizomicrobium sp.]|nr:amino acid permease [Rhizomicrobium sp.]